MPSLDREERLIILFALVHCGGKGTHGRIIDFILMNQLMEPRPNDIYSRSNGSKVVVNDLEHARRDLKDRGLLEMPERGVWAITEAGRSLITKFISDVSTIEIGGIRLSKKANSSESAEHFLMQSKILKKE